MHSPERLQKRVLLRLQQLDMLLVLMKTGSIRATSEVVGITQSAISKSLKELEAMMGTPLFSRAPDGLKPLPAAEIVARYAASTIMGFNTLCAELDHFAGGVSQPAHFGVTGGLSKILLDEAIRITPEAAEPGAVRSHVKDTISLLASLHAGTLDVLITHAPLDLDTTRIECIPIAVDALIAVAHPEHRVFLDQSPLWHYPWEAPQRGDPMRQRMNSALEGACLRWSRSVIEYSLPMIGSEILRGNTVMWVAESHVRPFLEQGLLLPVPLPLEKPLVQIGCLKLAGNALPPSASALWLQLTGSRRVPQRPENLQLHLCPDPNTQKRELA